MTGDDKLSSDSDGIVMNSDCQSLHFVPYFARASNVCKAVQNKEFS